MGIALYADVSDYNYKNLMSKRRSSVERKVAKLESEDLDKKKGMTGSPSMSKLIVSGNLANKFVEALLRPGSTISDAVTKSVKHTHE